MLGNTENTEILSTKNPPPDMNFQYFHNSLIHTLCSQSAGARSSKQHLKEAQTTDANYYQKINI